jgi:hypothetical protein
MAKTITIEFTDAQWALVIEHFRVIRDSTWTDLSTEEEFITELKRHVQEEIERGMSEKARIAAFWASKGAFND